MKNLIAALLVIGCYACAVLAGALFDYRATALALGGTALSCAVLGLVDGEGDEE